MVESNWKWDDERAQEEQKKVLKHQKFYFHSNIMFSRCCSNFV